MMKFLSRLLVIALAISTSEMTLGTELSHVVLVEVRTAEQSAELVESRVTTPIERALGALAGLRSIKSTSTHGLSRVEVSFAAAATELDLLLVKQRVLLLKFGGDEISSSIAFSLATGRMQ